MRGGLLSMLITVGGAVWVYYVLTVQKGLPENFGMGAGVLTAIALAAFFTKLKRKSEEQEAKKRRKR